MMNLTRQIQRRTAMMLALVGAVALVAALLLGSTSVDAQGSTMHPTFPLLDVDGVHVLESGNPVSTMQTCGACHDANFIERHSSHADVGLSDLSTSDPAHSWDIGDGYFGRWDPITYRYLSGADVDPQDLTVADWIRTLGVRHVGGGPAQYSQTGALLTELGDDAPIMETHAFDPETGELEAWDWDESGVVEMNCFLCHSESPNNAARIESLEAGEFAWAASATLLGGDLLTREGDEWTWNEAAFDDSGDLLNEYVTVQDPNSEHCGQCHGEVHMEPQIPLVLEACDADVSYITAITGQVHSSQKISASGMNIQDRDELARAWDIHAERALNCNDCHYAANNPIFESEGTATRPEHLLFDPRRMDMSEFIERPLHQFAGEGESSMRTCESCHDMTATHTWLPFQEQHAEVLSCESCHVPQMYAPALQSVDWTVLTAESEPRTECRGFAEDDDALITGFVPVLMRDEEDDLLQPHNLITAWYWLHGEDAGEPIPFSNLQAAWFDGDTYADDVLALFDVDDDGMLSDAELVLDTDEKVALIAERLTEQGLENPRIAGEIDTYAIYHNVTNSTWAIKECSTCHADDSRMIASLTLSDVMPGGVMPTFVGTNLTENVEALFVVDNERLMFQPSAPSDIADVYILGHDSVYWIDWFGILALVGVTAGITLHGGLRYLAARRMAAKFDPQEHEIKEVYMYTVYERQWHWLQTAAIFILLFTGLIIHKPDQFGVFHFAYVVQVHNVMGFILFFNAALAAFYHLASGEIRQYLPRPRGFFGRAIEQTIYYVNGIFSGKPHPFEKTPDEKLNPLQQLTYFGILNVLLPVQVITGLMMWGMQKYPFINDRLGGLSLLAPIHALAAWLFASFIVAHVYLTTTGHTPMANIRAMMFGWDEVEVHEGGHDSAPEGTD